MNGEKIELLNIFFIDWDNTLFPTDYILKNELNITNNKDIEKYKLHLIELDDIINNLFITLNLKGYIFIVTNANIKWINRCLNILPKTKNMIEKNKIKIISARDKYHLTNSSFEWKILTFKEIIKNIIKETEENKNDVLLNIMSFGDAKYEYDGLLSLNDLFENDEYKNNIFLLKSINFIKNPTFDEILNQLKVIKRDNDEIIKKIDFIDFNFI